MILIFHAELSLHRDLVFVGESIVLSPRAIPSSLESSHEPTRDIPLVSRFDRVHTKSTASGCFVTTDPIAEISEPHSQISPIFFETYLPALDHTHYQVPKNP